MKRLFGGIYKGRRVLITGHTGFKGSWLALWLKELGADVYGASLRPPTSPSHFDLLDLDIESKIVDIRDYAKLLSAFKKFKPEIVFHLAAQSTVRYSYEHPVETYETNVMGTLNILEAARKVGTVKAILVITSDKCYENKEVQWSYSELDPMGGHDPYSSSKGCTELLASSYRNSYFNLKDFPTKHNTLLATARAGNVIGGGDWGRDRLIPDIVKATVKKEKVIIRYPHAIRPWQHVLDALNGYLMLGQKLLEGNAAFAQAWNFGQESEGSLTVLEVLKCMKKFWPELNYDIPTNDTHPHEAHFLMLDCAKAKTELGWRTYLTATDTFKLATEWYKQYYTSKSILSKKQIKSFTDLYCKPKEK